MALVQKRNSSKTFILLGVLGAIIVAGALLYFLWLAPPSTTTNTTTSVGAARDLPIVSDFGDAVFSDPRFKSLESYGKLPVNIGNVGRANPFKKP